jgi:predicted DNA-binding transcriptional regulator YafY
MRTCRVGRMLQIVTALQSGQNSRVDDLAEFHKVSRRTVFRDLKELKENGIPCWHNSKMHTYSISPGFFLPPINLNHKEAMSLFLLSYKVRNHFNIPFKNAVLLAAMKIENNLPAEIRQYCNASLQNISVKPNPQAKIDLLDRIFTQLQEAILKKKTVRICYYMPQERTGIVFDLNPYHLMYNDHTWYVLGKSGLRNGVSAFRLNRIKELTTLEKCFIQDEQFDIREYLGRAWSMMPEGRLYHVKLRFLPEVAHDVAEVQWHTTQTATFQEDGSAIVEFRVDGLNEIIWWVLSYGDQVEVLSPKVLRQRICQIAQKMMKANQEESVAR